MTDTVIPLRFNVEEVGKHVKSSKKRFTWEVSMNGRQHSIVLDFSFISGKVKVTVDRKILLENELPANTSFQYPFTLDGNSLNVIQQGESFELRINNKVFSHLYNQAKTNKEFKKYEDQIKDFKVNQTQFQAKKLTLNIGGVGGGMKKKAKNQSTEGHNWNAFGEDEMNGFPNYFDGQSTSTASSKVEEQFPPVNVKKAGSLLDQDSNPSLLPQKQQKPQNILDFEAELQTPPPQVQTSSKQRDEFSTMQMMFQTMNLNPTQQPKHQVVIDNSEVDFFSHDDNSSKPTQVQPQIDFFSNTASQPVQSQKVEPLPNPTDFTTIQYMFATGQGVNSGVSLSTPSQQVNQTWNTQSNTQSVNLGFDMNTGINMSSSVKTGSNNNISLNTGVSPVANSGINMSTGFNFGNQSSQQLEANPSNFSTLQGLFSTNSMGFTQTTKVVQPPVVQQQTNFSMNPQYFATQVNPTQSQGFETSFGTNVNQFGTQNFSGQQASFSMQMNLNQPKTQPQQPITLSTSVQQTSEVIANDFGTMQMLFKTNNVPQGAFGSVNQPVQPIAQQSMPKQQNEAFSQQFATVGGGSTQSPNMMFMNTYGGNQGSMSFDMNLGQGSGSMMKKKGSQVQNVNASDLL